jgi:hypothetical protein
MPNVSATKKIQVPWNPVRLGLLGLVFLLANFAAPAWSQQTQDPQAGMVRGTILDQTGTTVAGAHVKLSREADSTPRETDSDETGQFLFVNVAPGPFQLTIYSEGLATQIISGTLQPRETDVIPPVTMALAKQVTEVRVTLSPAELAQEQIRQEEKQRVLGIIPNFYASYFPNAAPLTSKQKFELASKSSTDPITFVAVGGLAGAYHATNRWKDYGTGAQGYAKRYGAVYANTLSGTFVGSAILPSILKQDPRYFYKGKGSKRSRLLYALSNTFICKGDNGQWQPNYSNVGGSFISGGLAYLYYPANDRHGSSLLLSTVAIRLAETTVASIFQEFVVPRFTPNLPTRAPSQPYTDNER